MGCDDRAAEHWAHGRRIESGPGTRAARRDPDTLRHDDDGNRIFQSTAGITDAETAAT